MGVITTLPNAFELLYVQAVNYPLLYHSDFHRTFCLDTEHLNQDI